MRILLSALLLLFLLPLVRAEEEAPAAPVPDAGIVGLLEALEYTWESEDNGDFRLLFDLDDERSQLVWIRNRTYERDGIAMRDIWSAAMKLTGRYVSVKLADRLLQESWEGIMGSWARDGDYIVYIVKLPADASAEELDAAIGEVIDVADKLESDRSFEDDF